jgi:hypothetical protein
MDAERTWTKALAVLDARFPAEWVAALGLSRERGVHEMVGGLNHRTFPSDGRWKDEHGTVWRSAGLHVFDFKRPSWMPVPYGTIRLSRQIGPDFVTLICHVERAFRGSRDAIGDAIAPGHEGPAYSRDCGRAVLSLINIEVRRETSQSEDGERNRTGRSRVQTQREAPAAVQSKRHI